MRRADSPQLHPYFEDNPANSGDELEPFDFGGDDADDQGDQILNEDEFDAINAETFGACELLPTADGLEALSERVIFIL